MRKIVVLDWPGLARELLDLLARLLLELGFEMEPLQVLDLQEVVFSAVDPNEPIRNPTDLGSDDVVFVILGNSLDSQEGAVDAIRKLAGKGVRVIGVWPTRGDRPLLPEVINRYGAGAVPCAPESIRRVLYKAKVLGSTVTSLTMTTGSLQTLSMVSARWLAANLTSGRLLYSATSLSVQVRSPTEPMDIFVIGCVWTRRLALRITGAIQDLVANIPGLTAV